MGDGRKWEEMVGMVGKVGGIVGEELVGEGIVGDGMVGDGGRWTGWTIKRES